MIRSLYSATSGMRNQQVRMDVIANNIANISTNGFKSGRVNFAEIISQDFRGNSISQVGSNTNNPSQIGLGISVSSIDNNFGQGGLQSTGRVLDLALVGDGFFMVASSNEDIADDTDIYYTRDGALYVDQDGYLVNSSGLYVLSDEKEAIQMLEDPDTESIENIKIDSDGSVFVNSTPLDVKIGVAVFNDPEGLAKAGGNLYKSPDITTIMPVEEPSGYVVQSGTLEMSNTDLTTEFANLITTQRGYQASARVITTSDTMLGELIDLKR